MEDLNETYWDNRYASHDNPWDLGVVSPPIKAYIDQLTDTFLRILIPGGGNSYEAEYLFHKGFTNVYVVDVSKTALNNIKSRVADFPDTQLIHADFFELDMSFDIIIEQTFFCALNPKFRTAYVEKTSSLLTPKGILVGVLFNSPLNNDQPPFGGHKALYKHLFEEAFDIQIMDDCYNSIPARQGKELFFKVVKK
ncbi:TPMT family class I SAM-dependent methyltransferase [Psychroserpens sp. SPM9]|uniref:TPMT family class I SAM-dependent methyltransferase n=1 Tax=Psychroserpens sp. SPM9 TaxID=2975598 RepID=UPI0021A694A6|nr:TPMT family class I SAM-dependent methyltransferase [Psychroserpens sp. SPM9]MDG5491350.1 TPMT family class I SAM-dependent methyltransferase [Psychroserpens sp. SPM9]